jgi:hypothetical protein
MQAQLDLLMSSVVPSGAATAQPSSPVDSAAVADPTSTLFRIPAAHEVPIKGVHSAPPPTRNIGDKLDEISWARFLAQVEAAKPVTDSLNGPDK